MLALHSERQHERSHQRDDRDDGAQQVHERQVAHHGLHSRRVDQLELVPPRVLQRGSRAILGRAHAILGRASHAILGRAHAILGRAHGIFGRAHARLGRAPHLSLDDVRDGRGAAAALRLEDGGHVALALAVGIFGAVAIFGVVRLRLLVREALQLPPAPLYLGDLGIGLVAELVRDRQEDVLPY
eukprot:5475686-Prymnesium_polylepis.1